MTAQQPSDLVKRLRDIDELTFGPWLFELCQKSADRIEALEAAAAQPSREAELVKAARFAVERADQGGRRLETAMTACDDILNALIQPLAAYTPEPEAARSEREAELVEAMRAVEMLISGIRISTTLTALGRDNGLAAKQSALNIITEALAAYDTPATPDAGREEEAAP